MSTFTAAPDQTYTTTDTLGSHRLRWVGYGHGVAQFSCTCERFEQIGHCGHSVELSVLYGFAAKYWMDACYTFHNNLAYYQQEHAKIAHAGLIRCDRPECKTAPEAEAV